LDIDVSVERERTAADDAGAVARWRRAGWHMRAGYFWYYAAVGAFSPFTALYYRDLGFSGVQVGVLTALPAISASLTGPLWGAITDSLAIHRAVLRVGLAAAVVIALLASQPTGFLPLLALVGLLAMVMVPVPPLLDNYGVNVAERAEQSYGALRVWGSIGYMAVVYAMGIVMNDGVTSLFFVAYAACLGVTLLSVLGLPTLAERYSRPLLGGIRMVRHNRPLLLLMIVSFLITSGASIIYAFLGIHIRQMGGSNTLVGAAFSVSALSELPVIFFGGWLMAKLGARRLIVVSLVAYLVRFIAFGTITVPEGVIAAQLLHGLSFGAFLVASVTLAHRLAGQEHSATAQALLSTVSFGFGSITGSLIGGALLDEVSTFTVYRGIAVLMIFTLALFIVGSRAVGLDWPEVGIYES
jgi:PPP family 3-phenylpropionic acid transporter